MLCCLIYFHRKQVLERASTYVPRAAIYFKYLRESLENGEDFKLTEWRREWIKLTNEWQKRRNIFPVESNGDALNTSRWLFNKYLNLSNPETKLVLELNWTQINEISINYAYMFIWSQDHLVNPVHLSLDFHFPYTDTPMPIFFLKIFANVERKL